ncbi:MarR family transcriptional regulator [Corallococcus sp. Z5C101001]|nr:MarR family transcriptional regulator [Corallococcus silvisoli]TSC29595.1 MarR family transcriptional regulator [Corallococcus sp. Z5C101001]
MLAGDRIGQQLQTLSLLTRRIEARLGDSLGVNSTDLSAMEQLITSGPMSPTDLASRLKVTTAAGTYIVDRLERAGHVAREKQSDDRRKVRVVPAPESVARVFQHLTPMLTGLDALVAGLPAADRAVIEQFLGRVIDVYRAAADPAAAPSSHGLD